MIPFLLSKKLCYTPANCVCGGFTVCTLSVLALVLASVRPFLTFYFLNILKSHCWNFIKPYKHIHIYKTIACNKKKGLGPILLELFPCIIQIDFYIMFILYAYALIVPTPWSNRMRCIYNIDTLNICMEEFGSFFLDKTTAMRVKLEYEGCYVN